MDFEIRRWYASYYVEPLKKWIYGHLSVYPNGISFHDESTKPTLTKDLTIKFEEFAVMKKSSSSFVFSSITIVDNKHKIHWFASFQERSSVFAAVNHFFLNAVTKRHSQSSTPIPDSQQTKIGTALLKIATESEDTLNKAATRLVEQGGQIDGAISTMHDLHNDLAIATDIVSGLEAWLGRWKVPKKYFHVDPIMITDSDVPQVFDYEMLFSKIEDKKFHPQRDGVVRVSTDGVTILDLKQKILQLFKWPMISSIRVVSPWEMVITQNFIGSKDVNYAIVCAHMIHVLKKVELFKDGKKKLVYDTCVQPRVIKASQAKATKMSSRTPSLHRNMSGSVEKYDANCSFTSDDGQVSDCKEGISDLEIDQLTSTLNNLKAIALAVQKEEDLQNEKLTELGEAVERANDSLLATTKRTNKLL